MRFYLTIILVLNVLKFVSGSAGNNNQDFQICTADCSAKLDCPLRSDYYKWTQKPCFDCRHACMWKTVELFRKNDRPVPQFFGKWPFSAISTQFGPFILLIQEPASTLFSLLNLCACFWLLNEIWVKVSKYEYRMRNVWIGYSIVGIICWIFSMLFHSRDFWLTEYLDYFAAGALIFYAFYASLMLTLPFLQWNKKISRFILGSIVLLYARHVHYLFSRPSFDYGHNMMCCVGLSIFTASIYILWIWKEWYIGNYRPSLTILLKIIGIGLGSALFEVFDFPPFFYWSIDAHSLFHLATVPTPILMAKFVVDESKFEMRKARFGKEV